MSKVQWMEARLGADTQHAPLRRATSMNDGMIQGRQTEFKTAIDTHYLESNNSTEHGQEGEKGATGEVDWVDNHYFVVKVDRSPGETDTYCLMLFTS